MTNRQFIEKIWNEKSDQELEKFIKEKIKIRKDNPDIKVGYGATPEQAKYLVEGNYTDFLDGHIISIYMLDPEHKYLKDIQEIIKDNIGAFINNKRIRKMVERLTEQ